LKKHKQAQLVHATSWVELYKNAFEHNISQYKKVIGDKILAPVIKSNAYGHGLTEIAQLCQQNQKVAWLCVATLSESLKLREIGITKPVIILTPIGPHTEKAIIQDISVTAYNLDTICYLDSCGKQIGKPCKIHIKIDTGLSRLGVKVSEALELIKKVKTFEHITIEGIWTHFAESQSSNRSFTNEQVKKFNKLIENLLEIGIKIPLVHVSNSAGATTVTSPYANLVRVGIGIYGYWPSEYVKHETGKKYPNFTLKPILTWKTKIVDIKHIPTGTFVGYSRTYIAKKESKIAILPIGYFDGYDIRLSNKGFVIIKGMYAPVIGRICMNLIAVDTTDLQNVNIGDEVILVGEHPKINATDISNLTEMNPREVTTKIHPEIPRIVI